MIAVVDYGRGNLFSIGQALRHVGAEAELTSDPEVILAADRIVLPGVGAFADAMRGLRSRGLVNVLQEAASRGTPLLGICLGMQLLASRSEEFGSHDGLDLIPGAVRRLQRGEGEKATRIPNVGWRRLRPNPKDPFIGSFEEAPLMYFVHSYVPFPDDPAAVAASIDVNGVEVAAVIRRRNVIGCQFHPEKSGPVGLQVLQRFLTIAPSELS